MIQTLAIIAAAAVPLLVFWSGYKLGQRRATLRSWEESLARIEAWLAEETPPRESGGLGEPPTEGAAHGAPGEVPPRLNGERASWEMAS